MKVYVGQARGSKLIARLSELGFGEMTTRTEIPPRRTPWAFDNGAFGDWKAGEPFNETAFRVALDKLPGVPQAPDFLVVPDKVAAGLESLDFSLSWVDRLRHYAPPYLAVQDGMGRHQVEEALPLFAGIFVGGTLAWKVATGKQWVEVAHQVGKRCHVGRVGTFRRVRWALRIGADSIDSCLPLWSEGNLQKFLAGLRVHMDPQPELALREVA